MKTRSSVVALVVGVAVAAGGIAYASVPESSGVIHGCYSANAASKTNGSQLNIVDSDVAACGKGQTAITWSQTGPPGQDGVSVTSAALSAGDANCPTGGSSFTAANGTTYACNGAKGDKGDPGEPGPAGSTPVYTNYNVNLVSIGEGLTQTVASVTLPTGNYTLMGTAAVSGDDDARFGQCFLVGGTTMHDAPALFAVADVSSLRLPIIGDVSVTTEAAPIFLRCTGLDGPIQAAGALIATKVGTITPSE
ncbi:MAG TPA: hypothetical protein VFJ93_10500 [Gaiellaceae bacterium]|nr:hypothetical protein [Gaiellaceae bacterium]